MTAAASWFRCSLEMVAEKPVALGASAAIFGFWTIPRFSRNETRSLPSR